jgi:GNAT superfamily N-acetyltransferase
VKTFTAAELDDLADAYAVTLDMLAVLPGTRIDQAPRGTILLVSGARMPILNVIYSPRHAVAVDEVAALADAVGAIEVPWSIHTRGKPEPELLEVAASHGLTARFADPLMVLDPKDLVTRPTAPAGAVVHTVGVDRREQFMSVSTRGFDASVEDFGPLGLDEAFEIPGYTSYLVEADGRPVACGSSLLSNDHVCVVNIATLPEYRGRGYGRLATEAAIAGGVAASAHTAYLMASTDGLPLYESMGFRTAESWSYLTAGH